MKHLHVACAIIRKDGKILVTQRSTMMSLPLKWEFPGGKIRVDERPEECLKRELREELGIEVAIDRALPQTTHRYPTFSITLYPFICTIVEGEIILYEHAASCWMYPRELSILDWAEADLGVVELCQKEFEG